MLYSWQMSNLTTMAFYICQFQPKRTGDANFCQTAETYLYTWYNIVNKGNYFISKEFKRL